jgi:hypothetical protein
VAKRGKPKPPAPWAWVATKGQRPPAAKPRPTPWRSIRDVPRKAPGQPPAAAPWAWVANRGVRPVPAPQRPARSRPRPQGRLAQAAAWLARLTGASWTVRGKRTWHRAIHLRWPVGQVSLGDLADALDAAAGRRTFVTALGQGRVEFIAHFVAEDGASAGAASLSFGDAAQLATEQAGASAAASAQREYEAFSVTDLVIRMFPPGPRGHHKAPPADI